MAESEKTVWLRLVTLSVGAAVGATAVAFTFVGVRSIPYFDSTVAVVASWTWGALMMVVVATALLVRLSQRKLSARARSGSL